VHCTATAPSGSSGASAAWLRSRCTSAAHQADCSSVRVPPDSVADGAAARVQASASSALNTPDSSR
jgi:hypothetical protein